MTDGLCADCRERPAAHHRTICYSCEYRAQPRRVRLRRADPRDVETTLVGLPRMTDLEYEVVAGAACRGIENWFKDPQSKVGLAWRQAVCEGCPVKEACREVCDEIECNTRQTAFGTNWHSLAGVWAGEGPYARSRRRAAERRVAEAA